MSLSLVLTCGVGLFSVGCLSKKNEEVAEATAPPPPAAYPNDPAGYGGVTGAPAPSAYGGTATGTPAPATPPQPAPFELREGEELVSHLIVSGESLTTIASKYSSSISRIMSANGLSGTTIYAGKSIQVPVMKSSQVAMNNGSRSASGTPVSSYPAPAATAPVTPPTGYGNPAGGYQPTTPVYPGTTADPASTSYPRQGAPTAPSGGFPTPSF